MERLRLIFNFLFFIPFLILFKLNILLHKGRNKPLIVFDIDNTLALTRETFALDFNRIESNKNLCDACSYFLDSDFYNVVFLSVRPLNTFNTTKNWLRNNIKSKKKYSLFLCRTPAQKISLLQAIKFPLKKILIDDMSYDVDNEVILFDSALRMIKSKKLKYLGIDFISQSRVLSSSSIVKLIKAKINQE